MLEVVGQALGMMSLEPSRVLRAAGIEAQV